MLVPLSTPVRSRTVSLLWAEARPVVQVVVALRFIAAASLAEPGSPPMIIEMVSTVLVLGGWCALHAGIYLLNGVSDRLGDRANGSTRPLATGTLSALTAHRSALSLLAGGLLLVVIGARIANPAMYILLAMALVLVALGWGYSAGPRPLKTTTGGTVLACVGGGALTYCAGALAVGAGEIGVGPPLAPAQLGIVALLACWMAVGAITKDLGDVSGDASAGRRTLAVRCGVPTARRAGAAVAGLLGALAAVLGVNCPQVAAPAAVLAAGAVAVVLLALQPADSKALQAARRPYRGFVVTQYGANALILVSCGL